MLHLVSPRPVSLLTCLFGYKRNHFNHQQCICLQTIPEATRQLLTMLRLVIIQILDTYCFIFLNRSEDKSLLSSTISTTIFCLLFSHKSISQKVFVQRCLYKLLPESLRVRVSKYQVKKFKQFFPHYVLHFLKSFFEIALMTLFRAVPKPLLIEFGTHHGLRSFSFNQS